MGPQIKTDGVSPQGKVAEAEAVMEDLEGEDRVEDTLIEAKLADKVGIKA